MERTLLTAGMALLAPWRALLAAGMALLAASRASRDYLGGFILRLSVLHLNVIVMITQIATLGASIVGERVVFIALHGVHFGWRANETDAQPSTKETDTQPSIQNVLRHVRWNLRNGGRPSSTKKSFSRLTQCKGFKFFNKSRRLRAETSKCPSPPRTPSPRQTIRSSTNQLCPIRSRGLFLAIHSRTPSKTHRTCR